MVLKGLAEQDSFDIIVQILKVLDECFDIYVEESKLKEISIFLREPFYLGSILQSIWSDGQDKFGAEAVHMAIRILHFIESNLDLETAELTQLIFGITVVIH